MWKNRFFFNYHIHLLSITHTYILYLNYGLDFIQTNCKNSKALPLFFAIYNVQKPEETTSILPIDTNL